MESRTPRRSSPSATRVIDVPNFIVAAPHGPLTERFVKLSQMLTVYLGLTGPSGFEEFGIQGGNDLLSLFMQVRCPCTYWGLAPEGLSVCLTYTTASSVPTLLRKRHRHSLQLGPQYLPLWH